MQVALSGSQTRVVGACALVLVALIGIAVSIKAAPGMPGYFGAALALLMLAIAVVDARWLIIPDALSLTAFVLGFANAAVLTPDAMTEAVGLSILRGAVLALAFYGLRALYRRLRGRQGIGLGDVKLAAVAGVWLDWTSLPIVVEIAALSALAVIAVRTYASGRTLNAALKFPFGLFFAPSIWVCWLLEATLLAH